MMLFNFIYTIIFFLFIVIIIRRVVNIEFFLRLCIQSVDFFDKYYSKLFNKWTLIIAILFVFIFSSFFDIYYLGGDDSRVFYLYPNHYIENFASNTSSNLAVSEISSFLPPRTIMPFIYMLVLFKKIFPFLNLQSFFYMNNVIFAFFSFYYLLKIIYPGKFKYKKIALTLSSFIYVTSTFSVYSLFNSRLLAIYLMTIIPVCLILFIKSVQERKKIYLLLIAIILTLFSVITVALPWFAAAIICLFTFFLFLLKENLIIVIKNAFILLLFLIILNSFWMVYIPKTTLVESKGNVSDSIRSTEFIDENKAGIIATAEINNVFFPLNNLYHYKIQKNFNWPYFSIYEGWHLKLVAVNLIFIFTIILAGIKVDKSKQRKVYAYSLLTFLVSVYLYTVGIRGFGINLFVFLTNNIPGFVMFRNMYDKFGYALSFSFALVVFFSLAILSKKISKKHFSYLIFTLCIVSILNAKPFLLGEYRNLPIWTTQNTYDGISDFNQDYLDLVSYVSDLDTDSRFLQLPLANGNLAQIYDKNDPNRIYTGVSPFLFLSGKNDLSGISSFENYSNDLKDAILNARYYEAGSIFEKLGVRYIVVQNDISEEIENSYIYTDKLYKSQNEDFYDFILSEKLRDFGNRYSLYVINEHFRSDKIYLINSDDTDLIDPEIEYVDYKKLDNSTYELELKLDQVDKSLVFLEPFSNSWSIETSSDAYQADAFYNYGMLWELKNKLNVTDNKIILKSSLWADSISPDHNVRFNKLNKDRRFEALYIKQNPYVYIKPGTKKYWFLTKIYEPFQVMTKQRTNLFFADKRIAEIETWVDSDIPLKDILDLYKKHILDSINSSGMNISKEIISEEVKQTASRIISQRELFSQAIENNIKEDEFTKDYYLNYLDDLFVDLRIAANLDTPINENQHFLPKISNNTFNLYIYTDKNDQEVLEIYYDNKVLYPEKVNEYLFILQDVETNPEIETLSLNYPNAAIYLND